MRGRTTAMQRLRAAMHHAVDEPHLDTQPVLKRREIIDHALGKSYVSQVVTARVSVEQAATLGLARYVGMTGRSIGMETFGASAPLKALQRKFSFTPESIVAAAKAQIVQGR